MTWQANETQNERARAEVRLWIPSKIGHGQDIQCQENEKVMRISIQSNVFYEFARHVKRFK